MWAYFPFALFVGGLYRVLGKGREAFGADVSIGGRTD